MGRQNVAAPHRKAADEINERHRFARELAQGAVEHAIECGKLLAQVKGELPHGQFEAWVDAHCDFGARAARKYMQVAQNGTAVPFSSLREALGYESKPKAKPAAETPPTADPAGVPAGRSAPAAEPVDDAPPEYALSPDEVAAMDAEVEREIAASTDKILQADDRLAAAHAEVKRQAAEIVALKISRDGFMDGKAAVTDLLKREQRKTASLQKKLDAANDEITRLRERVALMEAD